jgi:hypothetical protein
MRDEWTHKRRVRMVRMKRSMSKTRGDGKEEKIDLMDVEKGCILRGGA